MGNSIYDNISDRYVSFMAKLTAQTEETVKNLRVVVEQNKRDKQGLSFLEKHPKRKNTR